jgi:cell fate regulator YaaT (PSP1 superfamily)
MIKVVGVSFKKNSKPYNFNPNDIELSIGDEVIVETERGLQYGFVTTNINEIKEESLVAPLSSVIRKASKEDTKKYNKNINDAKKVLQKCRDLAEKYELNMYIIDASFTHDRNQLFIRFMSDNRVDFRNLAKDLANIYKTRIELRQIGVRDRAKEIGGYGPCGRPLCCSKFMNDFDSISINMAKTQNIALNPSKINGICGRLMCCLKYENECYKECSKGLPQMNKKVKTPDGEGKVVALDVLKGTYKVNIPDKGIFEYTRENKDESN